MRRFVWPFILLIKLIITRSTFLKNIFSKLGFFQDGPGSLNDPQRPNEAFLIHYKRIPIKSRKKVKAVIELGAGRTNYASLAAKKMKVEKFLQLDTQELAVDVSEKIEQTSQTYRQFNVRESAKMIELENYIFAKPDINYMKSIQSCSYDFLYSHSVLQHIYLNELDFYLEQIDRVLKVGSTHSHYVDFRDCFSGKKNNLKVAESIWESELFRTGGFYTNRVPFSYYEKKFFDLGHEILYIKKRYFEKPLSMNNVSKSIIKYFTENDLNLRSIEIVLKK